MIKEALTYFRDQVVAGLTPQIIERDSIAYTRETLKPIFRPLPAALHCSTLTGLVDYAKSEEHECSYNANMIIVKSPKLIHMVSQLDETNQRETYMSCEFPGQPYELGEFIPVEEFILRLLTGFMRTPAVDAVLKVVGNLTDGTIQTRADDGITQTVSARTGVARLEKIDLPSPLYLAPYRTFTEVEQPDSTFILRLRSAGEAAKGGHEGPTAALLQVEDSLWWIEAILSIKKFLKDRLPEWTIVA